MKISQRLSMIADMVPKSKIIVDVGSDHAFLPIELINRGQVNEAVAGEVSPGPLTSSKENIKKYHLEDKIQPILADGLDALRATDGKVDVTIIAGMGGQLINKIINEGSEALHRIDYLLLQPNLDEDLVRLALIRNNFEIVDEKIIFEDGHFYEIILGKRQNSPQELSSSELKFGPILLKEESDDFRSKWGHVYSVNKKTISKMKLAKNIPVDKLNQILKFNDMIGEILNGSGKTNN